MSADRIVAHVIVHCTMFRHDISPMLCVSQSIIVKQLGLHKMVLAMVAIAFQSMWHLSPWMYRCVAVMCVSCLGMLYL